MLKAIVYWGHGEEIDIRLTLLDILNVFHDNREILPNCQSKSTYLVPANNIDPNQLWCTLSKNKEAQALCVSPF